MSVQNQITRIQDDRNTIRTKLVDLGLATSVDGLDELATAISGIANKGAISASVKEGETYTIPAGYHNGAGTVKGVTGGGNYELQAKTITPTKTTETASPDAGYYGLSSVTVKPIPDNFQDVSSVTATAADVLATKIFVDSKGTSTAVNFEGVGVFIALGGVFRVNFVFLRIAAGTGVVEDGPSAAKVRRFPAVFPSCRRILRWKIIVQFFSISPFCCG